MFAFVFRRILSAAPALLGFAIVLFALIAAAPPPVGLSDEEIARRFLNLPLLLNFEPQDRPRIVASAVARIPTLGEGARKREIDRLLQIGGAGLPDLVAALDKVSTVERARIARELAPLAFRMGIEDVADLDSTTRAEGFWKRVYDERGPDLRPSNVRRSLRRHLAERNEPLYARELRYADTAALGPLLEALDGTLTAVEREEVETLALEAARRAGARVKDVSSLRTWWTLHRAEYIELDALDRAVARITETRFGRWTTHAVTRRFGQSWRTGEPVLDDLRRRVPPTFVRALLALLLAYSLALPLGLLSAARRDRVLDRATRYVAVLLAAFPPFVLALLMHGSELVAVIAVAAALFPAINRQARAALLEASSQEFVRTARAKGVGRRALWVGHIGRNALGPVIAFASLQAPLGFASMLVIEEVTGLPGLGHAAIEALRVRDVPWLMALSMTVAVATTLLLVLSDLVHASFDPRVRHSLSHGHEER
jgi:peptide/nickel transport system permease protein